MATQFENGLTMNQLAERNAELVTEVEKLRAERDASLNAERTWEKTMMEVCGEDGPASVAAEIRNLRSLRDTALTALRDQVKQLTAENVGLKQAAEFATAPDMWVEQADGMLDYRYHEWYVDVLKAAMETPATDSIYAAAEERGVRQFAAAMAAQHAKCQAGGYFDRQVKVYGKAQELAESYLMQPREVSK
ncbi:hypothetical protein [Raoultella terrigena]|uniref:hypothetical protein n=1 Tax=Raoultella terrigena TaxID=577 RepID=UPI001F26E2BE|nr:hypothetical protein [Raoultella terrigena]